MALALQLSNTLSTQIQETFQHLYQLVDEQYTHTISTIKTQQRRLKLKRQMRRAKNYAEWKQCALEYDSLKNVKNWRKKPTDAYDWKYIKHLTDTLRTLRSCGEYKRVIHVIRSTCSRNIGNILNPELYSKTYIGTKAVIEDYQTEVITCLDYISKLPDSQLPRDRKLEFFAEARHAYGRTALLLSGGGGLGIYHYGVIKTLIERDMFPKVIAGSSAGSMFAALIGITKPSEFHKLMKPECINFSAFDAKPEELSLWRKIKRFFKEGQLLDRKLLVQFLRDNLGDITFQQAYDRTGLILNITVTGYDLNDGNHVLNYLTSPNVLIWSAVMASCSLPYLFGAIPLYCKNENNEIVPYNEMGKKFVDGSLGADLPTQKIAELFNVNFFVVSQVNPWVIPFMDHSESHRHSKRIFFLRIWEYFKTLLLSELVHRVNQFRQLGLFPAEPSRYLNLITQTYTGHTTISPVPHFTEYLTILKNPSFKRLCEGEKWGARITYPKMNRIETAMTIEKSLEANHQKAKKNFFRRRTQLQEVTEEYEPHRSIPLEPNSGTDLPSAFSDRLDHGLPRSLSDDEC